MPIKLISGAGGSLTVTPASTASNYTLTVPAVTANVVTTGDSNTITQTMVNQSSFFAGYGPAFSAYLSGNQTLSHNTQTKIAFNTENFDTASCFDSTTNYRFTPNVAGYYQVNLNGYVTGGYNRAYFFRLDLFKNGAAMRYSGASITLTLGVDQSLVISDIVYLNGSTDYLEGYLYHYDYTATTSVTIGGLTRFSNFSAALMRSA